MRGKDGWVICSLVLLFSFPGTIFAQEGSTYQEEYELYQQAQNETDPAKKRAICLEFVQKFKESQLDEHVSYLYAQQYSVLRGQSQWQQLASAAEEYLRYRPGDKNSAAAATEAYQKLGQPQKLVQFGTRLYNQSPSASTAYLVAKAYQSMNDSANFQKWAERTIQHAPDNAEMAVELVNAYWTAGDLTKAAAYAQKALKGLENSPDNAQTNKVRGFLYRALGEDGYIQGENSQALKNFKKSVQYDPMVDFAHLRLGYCYWRAGDIDSAIMSFARAVAIDGSSKREARDELYNLLRQRYQNTSKASSIIKAAKAELGIP
jgi:tetratricopeptide (TPR) repeat protein